MAVLPIVTWPHRVLETPAASVKGFDRHLRRLAEDMHETMDHAGGIGLAANQVNVLKRMIVVHIPAEMAQTPQKPWHKLTSRSSQPSWLGRRYTCVNPKILKRHGEVTCLEGCLSFPGNMEYVQRAETVTVAYQDLDGRSHTLKCCGLMSICMQHEIDHIDGVVFVERMGDKVGQKVKDQMLQQQVPQSASLSQR